MAPGVDTGPKSGLALTLGLLLGALPASAHAHGGFWRPHRIHTLADDARVLVLQSELRGLVVSNDAGHSFGWVCAEAFGRSSTSDARLDMLLVSGPRLLVASLGSGLHAAALELCAFEQPSGLEGRNVRALSASRAGILALVSDAAEAEGGALLFQSAEESLRFTRWGSPLPQGFSVSDVGSSPGDPAQLYVAGELAGALVVARADAAASAWQLGGLRPHASALGYSAEIVEVARDRESELYVLHDELEWSELAASHDELLVSEDGGAALRVLFRDDTPIKGFASSPDGATLLVASIGGLYRAARSEALASGSAAFVKLSAQPHYGLRWSERGLYAGVDEFSSEAPMPFGLALSQDQGATFQGVMSVCQVEPAACPAEAPSHQRCATVFSDEGSSGGGFKEDFLLSARCRAAAPSASDAGERTDAAPEASPSDARDASLDVATEPGAAEPPDAPAPAQGRSEASCRTLTLPGRDAPYSTRLGLLALAALLRRRRRVPKQRSSSSKEEVDECEH